MLVVLDVENISRGIIKEIAYVSTNHISCFSVKSPSRIQWTKQEIMQNAWLHNNRHIIRDGDFTWNQVKSRILENGENNLFYCKGLEKSKQLTKLLGVCVTNLEDYHSKKLKITGPSCLQHRERKFCALQ